MYTSCHALRPRQAVGTPCGHCPQTLHKPTHATFRGIPLSRRSRSGPAQVPIQATLTLVQLRPFLPSFGPCPPPTLPRPRPPTSRSLPASPSRAGLGGRGCGLAGLTLALPKGLLQLRRHVEVLVHLVAGLKRVGTGGARADLPTSGSQAHITASGGPAPTSAQHRMPSHLPT